MSLNSINKRLTLISDNLREERFNDRKLRRRRLSLKKSIEAMYKQWNYFGHRGPYTLANLFDYYYGSSFGQAINHYLITGNSLLHQINMDKNHFQGAKLTLPSYKELK